MTDGLANHGLTDESDARRYSEEMSPMMLKQARYTNYNVSMARQADGKAKRRRTEP